MTFPGAEPRASLERTLGPESATAGAIVIIDQLEEIFATDQTRAQCVQFIDRIAALHDAGVVVVLGLRADFFDRALEIDAVAGWLTANQVLVGPMSVQALRRVVVDPARAAGIEVEDRSSRPCSVRRPPMPGLVCGWRRAHCRCCPMRCTSRGLLPPVDG